MKNKGYVFEYGDEKREDIVIKQKIILYHFKKICGV